ncbi:hypothetical protein DFH06DRAFT_1127964 [Mycena polygramma]|nr:hypothetical protein DFH06DRAFT_1127964 [Mycena polygramma]
MFFSRRIIYTVAAALALVAIAEARCGSRGLPDDCPDSWRSDALPATRAIVNSCHWRISRIAFVLKLSIQDAIRRGFSYTRLVRQGRAPTVYVAFWSCSALIEMKVPQGAPRGMDIS